MNRSTLLLGLCGLAGCNGGDPDDSPTGPEVTIYERGIQVCADPGARDTLGQYEERASVVPSPTDPWIWHGGITAADLDGDEWLDFLAPLEQGMELYQGTPEGVLLRRGEEVFGSFDLSYASGVTAADYDADGDLDLYVTRIAGSPAPETEGYGRNRLLRNDDGVFADVTDVAGVDACGLDPRDGVSRCFRSMASSWGDYDRDGDLDLYVGNYGFVDETPGTQQQDMEPGERDFLYRNEGDGTFSDVSDLIPPEFHEGYTYVGGFHDFDADGDLDLYTINDFGVLFPNRVMWNNGDGSFAFVGGLPGQDPSRLDIAMTGMGLGIGDLNGDGWLDLAIPEWKKDTLLESRPEAGLWIDVAGTRGFSSNPDITDRYVGWGTELGDVDNDGDLDIVSQYGHVVNDNPVWLNPISQPDALYLNEPDGDEYTFVEVAQDWKVADLAMSRGVVLADVNRDGWIDIGKRTLEGTNIVYVSRCGAASWLTIELRQPGTANTYAVGARVEVRAGGQSRSRTITAGGTGYASSAAPELYFGLGDVELLDEIVVHWPDGVTSTMPGVDLRQRITITRE